MHRGYGMANTPVDQRAQMRKRTRRRMRRWLRHYGPVFVYLVQALVAIFQLFTIPYQLCLIPRTIITLNWVYAVGYVVDVCSMLVQVISTTACNRACRTRLTHARRMHFYLSRLRRSHVWVCTSSSGDSNVLGSFVGWLEPRAHLQP